MDGLPVARSDRITVNYRTRAAFTVMRLVARAVDRNGNRRTVQLGNGVPSTTGFVSTQLFQDAFAEDLDIYSIAVVVETLPAGPTSLWLEVVIDDATTGIPYFRHGQWISAGNPVVWPAPPQGCLYGLDVPAAVFNYYATCVNDVAAGTFSSTFAPGTGSRIQPKGGIVWNRDTVGRAGVATIRTEDDDDIVKFVDATLNAGVAQFFPLYPAPGGASGGPAGVAGEFVAGNMDLQLRVDAVAALQDAELGLLADLWGPPPTVTESAPANATITIKVEAVEVG